MRYQLMAHELIEAASHSLVLFTNVMRLVIKRHVIIHCHKAQLNNISQAALWHTFNYQQVSCMMNYFMRLCCEILRQIDVCMVFMVSTPAPAPLQ